MSPVFKILLSVAAAFTVIACLPQPVHAQSWTNGESATYVIGQTGFGLDATALTATGLYQPFSVAVDPATGKVFVCEIGNNRVLRYPSSAAYTNGAAAEAVFGQPDFTSNTPNMDSYAFNQPSAIAIDAAGNLWVVDSWNYRVLRFANAATAASGASASSVLGEPDFSSNNTSFTVSASYMLVPWGIFCKGTTLWVSDADNYRILRFDNAASLANGAPANAVFGQPNFTASNNSYFYGGPSATVIGYPGQLYVDGADNLWVMDEDYNRLLMFPNASTAANDEAATLVLGQTNFTNQATGGLTASTFGKISGVYGDASGNIYVSDGANNRILIFANAASLSNGSAASYVLGQPDFVSNGTGDGASQLYYPEYLWVSPSGITLMAPDPGNNRIMIWTPEVTLPLPITAFTGRLQTNGQALLQWQVSDIQTGGAAYTELEYATHDTSGFTSVLSRQPVSPTQQNYSYLQTSPAPGANYYRLRLIAPDGSSTYSQIVTITVGAGSTALSIYPNPAHSTVAITVPPVGGLTEIGIYSSTGTLMQRQVTATPINTIDISRLAAGLYTVTVSQGGSTMTSSFIKVN